MWEKGGREGEREREGGLWEKGGVLEVNNRRAINFFQLDHVEPFSNDKK